MRFFDHLPTRAACAVATAMAVAFVAATVKGPTIDPRHARIPLVVVLLWALPLVVYVLVARSRVGSLVIGLALLVATPLLLRAVIETDSSTAAIGLFTVPFLIWPTTLAAAVVDVVALRWSRRRGEPRPRRPQPQPQAAKGSAA